MKLTKSYVLRYDDEMEKLMQEVIAAYPEPAPDKASLFRAAIKIGLTSLKDKLTSKP